MVTPLPCFFQGGFFSSRSTISALRHHLPIAFTIIRPAAAWLTMP